jgi:4-hydroxy-tetrahydrodipicolinate synthase
VGLLKQLIEESFMFRGSFVAIVTPFKNGQVDEKKLRELVEWQLSKGTAGIVPVGTTGESPTLNYKEHARVIEIVVKAVRKRAAVIAGAGSNSTAEAIELTKEARALGADAALSVNPYYNKPTQEGLKAHFLAIAKAADLPIVLYNIPSRTGVSLTPATIAAMAKASDRIVGVKESTGSIDQATEIVQLCGSKFCVLSGDDSLTLPLMSVGASGVISVAANIIPSDVSRLVELCLGDRYQEARSLHTKMFPLTKSLFIETNPSPIKAAMKELGLLKDESLRLPMVSVTSETRAKVKAAIKAYGVKI